METMAGLFLTRKSLMASIILMIGLSLHGQGELTVILSEIVPERGKTLALALYRDEASLKRRNPYRRDIRSLSPGESTVTYRLTDLEAGELLIMGLQDGNNNEKMDTGPLGIPREGYFWSGQARIPDWDKGRFYYDGQPAVIRLEMIYW